MSLPAEHTDQKSLFNAALLANFAITLSKASVASRIKRNSGLKKAMAQTDPVRCQRIKGGYVIMPNNVLLISGPAGADKSAEARRLAS